jgi:hypothetical protein
MKCPNCQSIKYKQTTSRDHCPACNYQVDYWGNGANDVAKRYFEYQYYNEQEKEYDLMLELRNGNGNDV